MKNANTLIRDAAGIISTDMTLIYGKSWFRAKKRMTDIWIITKAEEAHKNRQPYAVCFENGGVPICFAEFNDKYVGVGFLDHNGREHTSFQFQEKEQGRLFLSMATCREFDESVSVDRDFDGVSPWIKNGTTYFFKLDGKVVIEKDDFIDRTKTKSETVTDVWANWESYPVFGEYDGIMKLERDIGLSRPK